MLTGMSEKPYFLQHFYFELLVKVLNSIFYFLKSFPLGVAALHLSSAGWSLPSPPSGSGASSPSRAL